jgi:hypothetical protein
MNGLIRPLSIAVPQRHAGRPEAGNGPGQPRGHQARRNDVHRRAARAEDKLTAMRAQVSTDGVIPTQ